MKILKLIERRNRLWTTCFLVAFFLLYPAGGSSFYDEVLIRIENPKKRNLELNGVVIAYTTGYSRISFDDLKEFIKKRTGWTIEGKEYAGFLEFFSCGNAECLEDSPVFFYLFMKGKRTRVLKLEFKSINEISKIGRIDEITMKYENMLAHLGNLNSEGREFSFSVDEEGFKAIRRDRVDITELSIVFEE